MLEETTTTPARTFPRSYRTIGGRTAETEEKTYQKWLNCSPFVYHGWK
jgi:hypothetical protein